MNADPNCPVDCHGQGCQYCFTGCLVKSEDTPDDIVFEHDKVIAESNLPQSIKDQILSVVDDTILRGLRVGQSLEYRAIDDFDKKWDLIDEAKLTPVKRVVSLLEEVAEAGSSTPLPSENSSLARTSTSEPPQDTSLDDYIEKSLHINKFMDWHDQKKAIKAWHKAERAKLFEQIRSEVIGKYEEPGMDIDHILYVDNRNKLRKQQREALTRLESKDE